MRETGSGTKKEIDRYLEEHHISDTALHIVARMNDLEAIRKSVAGGLGISILSACSAKDLADTHQILMFPLNSEKAVQHLLHCVQQKPDLKATCETIFEICEGLLSIKITSFIQRIYKGTKTVAPMNFTS